MSRGIPLLKDLPTRKYSGFNAPTHVLTKENLLGTIRETERKELYEKEGTLKYLHSCSVEPLVAEGENPTEK